jgi:uncharacterized FAD-dependent dehydrogenase
MAGKNFLEELKKAVDDGNFNSNAAKKINDIDKLADKHSKSKSTDDINQSINDRVKDSGVKTVDKDKIADLNTEYEEKMRERSEQEKVLAVIATLDNIDHNIEKEFSDLISLIEQQKNKYDLNDQKYSELLEKINELTNKYNLSKKD